MRSMQLKKIYNGETPSIVISEFLGNDVEFDFNIGGVFGTVSSLLMI